MSVVDQFNPTLWLLHITNYKHIIHTITRHCWTKVFIHWHKKTGIFVVIPKIFSQHNHFTLLYDDLIILYCACKGLPALEQLFLLPPPTSMNGVKGHTANTLSSTVPRWPAQQNTLGCVLVQLAACRFPSCPQSTPPLINRAQSDLSASVCVWGCVRVCVCVFLSQWVRLTLTPRTRR